MIKNEIILLEELDKMGRGSKSGRDSKSGDGEWGYIDEVIRSEIPKSIFRYNFYLKKKDQYFPILESILQSRNLGNFNEIELIKGKLALLQEDYGWIFYRNSVRVLFLMNCDEGFQPVIYRNLFIFILSISEIEICNRTLIDSNNPELVLADQINDNTFYININMNKIPIPESHLTYYNPF